MRLTYRTVFGAMACALLVSLALAGCGFRSDYAGSDIYEGIHAALEEAEPGPAASVDMSEIVEGEWTRMIVVCYDATPTKIDRALGFDWGKSRLASRSDFEAMLIFADDDEVIAYVDVSYPYSEDLYYTTCSVPTGDAPTRYPPPIVVPRAESILNFVRAGRWYITLDELERLAQ